MSSRLLTLNAFLGFFTTLGFLTRLGAEVLADRATGSAAVDAPKSFKNFRLFIVQINNLASECCSELLDLKNFVAWL